MKDFFKRYPNAEFIYKVGDKYYLSHAGDQAYQASRITGNELEVIKNPKYLKLKKNNNGSE